MPFNIRSASLVKIWISGLIASVPLILIFASKASLLLMMVIFSCLIAVSYQANPLKFRLSLSNLFTKETLIWIVLAFAVYGCISTIWSVSPVASLRLLIFEFLMPVLLVVGLLAVDNEILAAIDLKKSAYGFLLAGILLVIETRSGMALRGFLGLKQWQGALAHAGVTLAFVAPLVAFYLLYQSRFFALVFFSLISVSIALIINDSAKLALVAFLFGALIYSQRMIRFRSILFFCFALYIFSQPWIWSTFGADYLSTTLLGFKASSIHRLYIWETFSRLSLQNLLHGYGIASGHVLFQFDAIMASLPEALRQYVDVWHPHNNYLELWLDLGLIGIILFLLAMWQIFNGPWLAKRSSFASFVAIAGVAACSHGLWQGWWIALICLVVMLQRVIDAKMEHDVQA